MKKNMAAKGVSSPALPDKPKLKRTVKPPQRVIPMNHRSKQNSELDSNRQTETMTSNTENEEEIQARRQAEEEEKEKQRKIEEARKLREQREAERQSRLRLSKNLEAVRPTASVSGKQDAAENTPVIFDYDASYEPAPQTLPGILAADLECLLLTIHLSSNGEIILHRGKTNKSVDTGVGLSASYTVLLTWLLSLVPENFNFLHGRTLDQEDRSSMFVPPFYVLGLQQIWLDEHLCLVVAVTPVEQFDARYVPVKSKKTKVKDEIKDSSPFQQHVSKYLSVNTLHTVCPWLQDMVSVEVTCPKKDKSIPQSYIYRPPLPNITTKPLSTFVQVNHDPQAARKVFNSSVGFFFQTVDSDETFCDQIYNESSVKYDTQNTMSLIYKKIFCEPRSMMAIFNRILQEGLDLSGIRLLYPTQQLLSLASGQTFPASAQGDVNVLNNIGPVLAIALRGTFARTIWLDAVGPSDPALARRTDPNSLCALFGGLSRDECLLFCPRNITRVHTELTRWFGGRVPPGGVIDVGTPYTRKDHLRSGSPKRGKGKRGHESRDEKTVVPPHRPPAALTATTKNDIFLIISPLVPLRAMGIILSTCQRRGYQIRGVRRSRLTTRKCNYLGIDSSVIGVFCPGSSGFDIESATFSETTDHQAIAPSTFLQIQKENATHSAASLIEAFMIQLTMQGIMNSIQGNTEVDLSSKHLFHAARFSDSLLATLGGDFSKCIDYDIEVNPSSYIVPKLYTNPEVEEIVVLLLLGHEVLKSCGLFVGKLLNLVPYSKSPVISTVKDGFELLGIKWLPSLSMSQAKEVTPFEVGDRSWKENIHTLTSEPALVLVLRSVGAFKKLESAIPKPDKKSNHMDFLMSKTAEEAYSFARSFFMDRELFCDPQSRPLLPYLPQSRYLTGTPSNLSMSVMKPELLKESIFEIMQSGPRPLTTVLLIKPRAVKRHLPKILKKVVQESFHIIGLRLELLDKEATISLFDEDDMDETQLQRHIDHMTSGPCVLLSLQRENAVKKLLDLVGPKDPVAARRQSQFLWRGVFGADSVLNAFHVSSNYVCGILELNKFFPDGLCCEITEDLKTENITCPAVDNIIDIKYQDHRSLVIEDQTDSIDSSSPRQLLLQTTCVVLNPLLSKCLIRSHLPSIDIIEGLINNGFELVGSRMIWFNKEQAEHFLHLIDAGSFAQVPTLLSGPSIVLALQRDNAVISFDSYLGSNYGSESLIGKYGKNIIRPADLKQVMS
ncbi:hypothetical protein KUTeg_001030 [Tegillarca granosa]|uniref:Nucleoside diphosphate kinase-like domain-containing protein n=1 Tax=Tegillarca granosa TaxID=220873 RepID=A0ABQ9FZI1_TEGGR|nr:hypothetical protein KUTeg_001030 [Tegillarca granosa]